MVIFHFILQQNETKSKVMVSKVTRIKIVCVEFTLSPYAVYRVYINFSSGIHLIKMKFT